MTAVLPDADELVRLALTSRLATMGVTATVVTLWPVEWYDALPLVVARRVPAGATPDPRGLDAATIALQAAHQGSRAAASLLARQAYTALYDACTAQFSSAEAGGYLSSFDKDASSPPAEIRTGDAAVQHTDVFRFAATCRVFTRPTL